MKTNTVENIPSTTFEAERTHTSVAEQVLKGVNEIVQRDIQAVLTAEKNIKASNDLNFQHSFGRDTAISADKLLLYDQEVVHQAILLLFSNQGVKNDEITGEKPGKIFHEYKERGDDPEQQVVFDNLQSSTGIGDQQKIISYTSVDATPECIHLLARYVEHYGRDVLHEQVNRQGEMVAIETCFEDAVQWVRDIIARSDIGLVGTRRTNPRSVTVADLLDGGTSFMHADGRTLVNHRGEVNTINFQSLGYQALMEAATITANDKERRELIGAAEDLRQKTIEYFWMPEKNRVAMAVDRDEQGQPRRLETDTILPAVALRTGIFDDRPDIVEAILKGLYTPDMMTCVGPRTQTAAMDVGYTRYQEPPWPVLVGRVVEGAMRYGEDTIAIDLIERMLMGVYTTGKSEEFHQVTKDNELGLHTDKLVPGTTVITATNKPEAPQAWTAATLWGMTHEALPLLAERRHLQENKTQVGETLDIWINKKVKTVPYVLHQADAWKIEEAIMAEREGFEPSIP